MRSEICKPNHLKSGQMAAILSKTICNLDKKVWISNSADFEWLEPNHLKSNLLKFRILDPHFYASKTKQQWKKIGEKNWGRAGGFRLHSMWLTYLMMGAQIPKVFGWSNVFGF